LVQKKQQFISPKPQNSKSTMKCTSMVMAIDAAAPVLNSCVGLAAHIPFVIDNNGCWKDIWKLAMIDAAARWKLDT
jgi:hypothetical protein